MTKLIQWINDKHFQKLQPETSLVDQWFESTPFNSGNAGSIPGWGMAIPTCCGGTYVHVLYLLSSRAPELASQLESLGCTEGLWAGLNQDPEGHD